jgi:hypothetical protein
VYVDHAYFKRTTAWTNMRVVRGGHHLTKVIERTADRLQQWGVRVQPWRGTGRSVVVIPPSEYHCAIHGLGQWLPTMLERLRELTDRPVVVKGQKGGLEQFLVDHDTHAVVCAVSVAGVEAGLAGYPVFSTPLCASWPINAGPLEAIEHPERPEREPWARSLSYACWSIDELNDISKTTGNPALKEILCGS